MTSKLHPTYDDPGPPDGWRQTLDIMLALKDEADERLTAGVGTADAVVTLDVVQPELTRLMAMRPAPLHTRLELQIDEERTRQRGWVMARGNVWGPK